MGVSQSRAQGAKEPEVISRWGPETAVHISPGRGLRGPAEGDRVQTQNGGRLLGAGTGLDHFLTEIFLGRGSLCFFILALLTKPTDIIIIF